MINMAKRKVSKRSEYDFKKTDEALYTLGSGKRTGRRRKRKVSKPSF